MGRETTFKAVNLEYRGTVYQKHHHKMVGGGRRFISDTACPKVRGVSKGMEKPAK